MLKNIVKLLLNFGKLSVNFGKLFGKPFGKLFGKLLAGRAETGVINGPMPRPVLLVDHTPCRN